MKRRTVSRKLLDLEYKLATMQELLLLVINDLKRPEQGILPPWKQDLLERASRVVKEDAGRLFLIRLTKLKKLAFAANALEGRVGPANHNGKHEIIIESQACWDYFQDALAEFNKFEA